jgi:hypothetical protein
VEVTPRIARRGLRENGTPNTSVRATTESDLPPCPSMILSDPTANGKGPEKRKIKMTEASLRAMDHLRDPAEVIRYSAPYVRALHSCSGNSKSADNPEL